MSNSAELDAQSLVRLLRADHMVHDAEIMINPNSGVISALIVPQGFRPASELRQRAMLHAGAVPGRLQLVLLDAIPRRPDGSLDESAAAAAMKRSGTVHKYEAAATGMEKSILDIVAVVLPGRDISITDSISALGGDSLATIEITTLISERLGIDIPAQDVYRADSFRDLSTALCALQHPSQGKRDGST